MSEEKNTALKWKFKTELFLMFWLYQKELSILGAKQIKDLN